MRPPEADEPPRPTEAAPEAGAEAAARARAEAEQLRRLRRERQARLAKVLVALAIAVLLAVFILANAQPVRVDFVFFERQPRLIWVMFACAVLGGVVGYLVGRPGRRARPSRGRDAEGER
ncbi:MAG TPA: LapA family protein [Actinomycetota bacterium]|nr:LapA family protein [Actinomycetota bacterium]